MRIRSYAIILATAIGLSAASGAGALELANGLAFNGLAFNGLAFNGLAFNGLAFNGRAANGAETDAAQLKAAVLQDGTVVTLY
ncbi:hypothetical protein [Microvirga sp. 2TAF3]|uniref:hypothetical protein n=1 Tax=Microvirga sp. 2TAF3 TaxID=3233014 RepID=UPI003F982614